MRWLYVLLWMIALAVLPGCGANEETHSLPPSVYEHISWGRLLPKNWDPAEALRGMDFSKIKDSDPRAIKALQHVREIWDHAPIEPGINGARVRIAGYITPLDNDLGHVREFLLVPSYGACIHTPPPPANQIIHVVLGKTMSMAGWYSAVFVSGRLETVASNTSLGSAGYRMSADIVVPYTIEK